MNCILVVRTEGDATMDLRAGKYLAMPIQGMDGVQYKLVDMFGNEMGVFDGDYLEGEGYWAGTKTFVIEKQLEL